LSYSKISQQWQEQADLAERKKRGQYMTPQAVRERLLALVELRPGMKVLDPGVGTGEFLRSALDMAPEIDAYGWDLDDNILPYAQQLVPEATLLQRDALTPSAERFDLVIGNPPYFQVSDPELRRRFSVVVSGRANIFALFFKAGMDLLNPGGQLAYVVPPSMNNGRYFQALRQWLCQQGEIEQLQILTESNLFEQATTAAQLIVIRKGQPGTAYTFSRQELLLFSPDPKALAASFSGRATLWELGYRARTGTVVWNQAKDRLSQEHSAGAIRLIWSRDLSSEYFLDRPLKWIQEQAAEEQGVILVNRIVGQVGRGQLRVRLAPQFPYCAENHVNVIVRRNDVEQLVSPERLLELLSSDAVVERLRLVTGNTQISATELTHLLPLG